MSDLRAWTGYVSKGNFRLVVANTNKQAARMLDLSAQDFALRFTRMGTAPMPLGVYVNVGGQCVRADSPSDGTN